MTGSRRSLLVALVLVGAVVLGACSDSDDTDDAVTDDTGSATTAVVADDNVAVATTAVEEDDPSSTTTSATDSDDAGDDGTTTTAEDEDASAPGITTTIAPPPDPGATYRVAFVEDGDNGLGQFEPAADVLNVRDEPSASGSIVGTLAPGSAAIRITGDAVRSGSSDWVPITTDDGLSGFVNRRFLVRDISSADFCADAAPVAAFAQFISALADGNDLVMGDLIDEGRGVWYSLDGGPPFEPVRDGLAPFAAPARDWYVQDGTGDVINGTYGDVVAPRLLDALGGGGTVTCNEYEVGGSAGFTSLLRGHEYANYLAIHSPPIDNDFDWVTAVVGLDLDENQRWVVVSVVRFNWLI